MSEWQYRRNSWFTLTVGCFCTLVKKSLQLNETYTTMENAYVDGKSMQAFSVFLLSII